MTVSPCTLRRRHFTFYKWGMLIVIEKSKTIQFFERTVEIPVAYSPLEELCAVTWTLRHFNEVPAGAEDYAFRLSGPGGSVPQDYKSYQDTLKYICERAGLDPAKFSTHSMRRGGATFLSMIGVSVAEIKQRGDWQ